MTDDIFEALGKFSLHVGMKLMEKAMQPDHEGAEIDKTALADIVFDSCVEQTSRIIELLGVIRQMDDASGDFGFIVGTIAREQQILIEGLTGAQISISRDCSRNVGEVCMRAVAALRGEAHDEQRIVCVRSEGVEGSE